MGALFSKSSGSFISSSEVDGSDSRRNKSNQESILNIVPGILASDLHVETIESSSSLDLNNNKNSLIPIDKDEIADRHSYSAQKLPIEETNIPGIQLMEHEHTLLCERKNRTCSAVGQTQELEKLTIINLADNILKSGKWLRLTSNDYTSSADATSNSIIKNNIYRLDKNDIGYFIGFQYHSNNEMKFIDPIGPILPGAPQLLELSIVQEISSDGRVKLRAVGKYIGGIEGSSEYWWIRIKNGKRIQLTLPTPIRDSASEIDDPRLYFISDDDLGCDLKVKCCPIRSDLRRGEIFTSKAFNIKAEE